MCSELETRDVLDRYIASAFGLKLSKGRLTEIDKKNYVLTLDFALKVSMHIYLYYCLLSFRSELSWGFGFYIPYVSAIGTLGNTN